MTEVDAAVTHSLSLPQKLRPGRRAVNHRRVTVHGVASPAATALSALTAVADALDQAVIIVDTQPVVTHANAAAGRLLDDGPLVGRIPVDVLGAGLE